MLIDKFGVRKTREGSIARTEKSLVDSGTYYTFDTGTPNHLADYLIYKDTNDNGLYTVSYNDGGSTRTIGVELIETDDQEMALDTDYGSSTVDGAMVLVRFNGNFTISTGATLSVPVRKKGLAIFVAGDLTVNGTISMSSRGANATGQNVRLFYDGSTGYDVPSSGASGGSAVSCTASASSASAIGNPGGVGTNGATGGGGSGEAIVNWSGTSTSGAGSSGTSFSGGTGGGGCYGYNSTETAGSGAGNGGQGGQGKWYFAWTYPDRTIGGGGGNPGGLGHLSTTETGVTSEYGQGVSGTGGLLAIYVGGDIHISSSGSIEANAPDNDPETGTYNLQAAGGGSGGGTVNIFYGGTLTNLGSITASGGAAMRDAGPGGNGTTRSIQVSFD